MGNLLTNPGAEIAAPPPQLAFGAERSILSPYAGAYSFHLPKDPLFLTAGRLHWDNLVLRAGQVYPVSCFIKRTSGSGKLRTRADSGDGVYSILGSDTGNGGAWELWEPGAFTADGTSGGLQIQSLQTEDGDSWFVDDVAVEGPMAEGMWDGVQGLLGTLKGITGSPYNTDFDSRIYTRLITPLDNLGIEYPFGCLALSTIERPEHQGRVTHRRWTIKGYFFFREDETAENLETASGEAAAKASDDIHAALMAADFKPTAISDIAISDIAIQAGVLKDYGEMVVTFDVTQIVNAAALAP